MPESAVATEQPVAVAERHAPREQRPDLRVLHLLGRLLIENGKRLLFKAQLALVDATPRDQPSAQQRDSTANHWRDRERLESDPRMITSRGLCRHH